MIIKNDHEVGFIHDGTQNIERAFHGTDLVFEQGFTREQEGVPPLTTEHVAIGKDLKNYEIYGNTIRRVLPEEYQEVEYLENSGTQYIDTGVTPTANFKFHIVWKDIAAVDSNYVAGCRASGSGTIFAGISGSSGSLAINLSNASLATPNNYRKPNVMYDCVADYNDEGTGTATLRNLNTGEIFNGTQTTQISTTASYKLFALRSAQVHRRMALYEYQCWNDGVLVRNFVPCYRKSDNVAGLYDTVEGVFYTKSGSGDFIVGPDVASSNPTTLAPVEMESVGDYISPNGVPVEYQEVEYLEGTGTQYIDTGIKPTANFKWVLDNEFVGTPPTTYYYNGLYDDTSDAVTRVDIALTQTYLYMNYGASNSVGSYTGFVNSRYTYTVDAQNMTWAYNETTGSLPATSSKTSELSVFLFARNEIGTANRFCNQKTYSSKIYDGGVLVQNLIPCYRKSDNKPGMYDTVGGTFYTNAGTGEFTVGHSMTLPEAYKELEYVESAGANWIDTNFTPNQDTSIEIDYQLMDLNYNKGYGFVYGARNSVSSTAYSGAGMSSTSDYFRFNYGDTGNNFSSVLTDANRHLVYQDKNKVYIDGTLDITMTTQSFTAPNTLYIFATNAATGSVSSYSVKAKIFSCKIWDNGTLIRSFVPSIRKSDNKVGMYDLVNGVFYLAAAPDALIAGPTIKRYKIPVTISGKNSFDSNSVYSDTSKFTVEDGVISGLSTNFHGVYFYIPSDLVGKELTFSAYLKTTTSTNIRVMASVGGSVLNGNYVNSSTDFVRSSVTFTPTSTSDYVKITYGSGSSTIYAKDVQLEESSTATEYEPYAEPTTVDIYVEAPLRKGGEVADYIDFKNQKVIRVLDEVDMGELRYTNNGTDSVWGALTTRKSGSQNGLTSKLKQVAGSMAANAMPNNSFKFYTTSTSVAVKMTGISSSNATEMLSGTQLVYELATPIEEQTEIPVLPTAKGTTIYEVDTKVQPSKMYIKYKSR